VAFNDEIERVKTSPGLRKARSLGPIPTITGRISDFVLSLHNLGDLFVPFHHEVAYAQDVERWGRSELLVQRAIRGVSHCGSTPIELVTAFSDLVTWVEDGVKPEGDVVQDPATVADAEYGCRLIDFATPGGHVLAKPCPTG